jgi:hypothetical protein
MTDSRGTYEHALFTEPRPEHGYCTDDMARVLMVASREPEPSPEVCNLANMSLRFLDLAQSGRGKFRNRMDQRGRWLDRPSLDDCWGRSIWGLGTAAARNSDQILRELATVQFERASTRRSPWPRAMAFAALGAAEVLAAKPDNASARRLLSDGAEILGRTDPACTANWTWPERRLTYANAALPEAMIAAGDILEKPALLERGLGLLEWLVNRETRGGHLSVTPVGGAGPGDEGAAFDQQPIEAASLADACARAASIDRNPRWTAGVAAAAAWFLGDNDARVVMWDPITGGGFDGLEPDRANLNEGTESTLALLSTLQHARDHLPVLVHL